jgi:hypothetical protein
MMQTTRKTAIAIGLTVMSAAGLTAQNRDATTAAASLSCGATVTRSVTLTKDLLNCAVDGLVVGANGITIDLNGHRITGTFAHLSDDDIDPNRCYCGINDTAGYNRITLSGGVIEGFYDGADFYDAHDIVVRDLISRRHRSDGLYFVSVSDVLVADSQFSKAFRGVSAFFGAHYNQRVIVRNSSFVDIEHAGVALVGTDDSVVRDTTMTLGRG